MNVRLESLPYAVLKTLLSALPRQARVSRRMNVGFGLQEHAPWPREQTMTNQRELLLSTNENLKTKAREFFLSAMEKLAQAVCIRDGYTGEHSRRVTLFALLLGQQLHLSTEDLEVIRVATPLHDIGKIGI